MLESGAALGPVEVAYETYGTLDDDRANAVVVCHALTGDAHAAGFHPGDDRPGWWDTLIGPGKPLDTDRLFVVCANLLGGCQGTTGPSSTDPADGAALRPRASRCSPSATSSRCTARSSSATSGSPGRWAPSAGRSAGCRSCSGRSTTPTSCAPPSWSARPPG